MPTDKLHWKDIEEIGLRLTETHPGKDPLAVRFTELRRLVESLPDFQEEPGHPCNESILEAIQVAWHDEREDIKHDEDEAGYKPPTPYKPGD